MGCGATSVLGPEQLAELSHSHVETVLRGGAKHSFQASRECCFLVVQTRGHGHHVHQEKTSSVLQQCMIVSSLQSAPLRP